MQQVSRIWRHPATALACLLRKELEDLDAATTASSGWCEQEAKDVTKLGHCHAKTVKIVPNAAKS